MIAGVRGTARRTGTDRRPRTSKTSAKREAALVLEILSVGKLS